MNATFLFVNGSRDSSWLSVLQEALNPFGTVANASEHQAIEFIVERDYELVVVDGSSLEDVPRFVSQIRTLRPRVRIIVVSAAPLWGPVRAAFRAGAADCIQKSRSPDEVRSTFQDILARAQR